MCCSTRLGRRVHLLAGPFARPCQRSEQQDRGISAALLMSGALPNYPQPRPQRSASDQLKQLAWQLNHQNSG